MIGYLAKVLTRDIPFTTCALVYSLTATVTAAPSTSSSDWLNHNGGVEQSSFSSLREINDSTVSRLRLKWSLDLPGEHTLEATPLAIGGVLYFTGSTCVVYAVSAANGNVLWKYDPEISKHLPEHMKYVFGVNRGVAYRDGRLFVGTIDGRLIALDANSGKPLWSVTTVTAESRNTITGAPLVTRDKVLIGNGGADWSARGYVTAYDVATGAQRWRFYTVPGDPSTEQGDEAMQMAARTWGGDWWKVGGGGGTVWDGMTYDPEFDRVYVGVGNSGPYDPRVRSPGNGDNLFLASIVALDERTGRYVWHYQANPREAWDYKATANMITATLRIGGKMRKVLMQSPTNGFFYVLDRTDGKLISAEKTGKVTWADHIDLKSGRPVEAKNIRYETGSTTMWPSPFGTHDWQAMAFNPGNGLVYIPYQQIGATWSAAVPGAAAGEMGGAPTLAGVRIAAAIEDADDGKGALLAWDPVTQRARWKAPLPYFWNGGVLATGGNLVFQGDATGQFAAHAAADGKPLWTFDAKLGIIAAPISYQADGHQQISVLVGYGGATALWSKVMYRGWKFGLQPRRLLTFALDGKAELPATPPPDAALHAVDDPKLVIDAAKAAKGAGLYASNCAMCHGGELQSAGAPAPDLRESQMALSKSSLAAVVEQGALATAGMPRFEALSDEELSSIHQYIRSEARRALEGVK